MKIKLSKEEKRILNNICEDFETIYRENDGELFLTCKDKDRDYHLPVYDSFGFIKNGEEYKISDLLGDE